MRKHLTFVILLGVFPHGSSLPYLSTFQNAFIHKNVLGSNPITLFAVWWAHPFSGDFQGSISNPDLLSVFGTFLLKCLLSMVTWIAHTSCSTFLSHGSPTSTWPWTLCASARRPFCQTLPPRRLCCIQAWWVYPLNCSLNPYAMATFGLSSPNPFLTASLISGLVPFCTATRETSQR